MVSVGRLNYGGFLGWPCHRSLLGVTGDPGLALLVDHDDSEREYEYASEAGTFEASEPVLETARKLGWTVFSMRDDWDRVFLSDAKT